VSRRTSFAEMNCSLARTLDVVGEWWTLLVLREVFFGRRGFTQMHRTLGVARNVLSDRLRTLVEAGILERRPDPGDGRRHEFHLTEKGRDLLPALVMLMQWGDRWADDGAGPPVLLVDRDHGTPIDPVVVDHSTGAAVDAATLTVRPGPGFDRDAWPDVTPAR
jgi:DNA-binding HxlR family transcriptional regulator